jgi:hypothetical protein
MRWDLHKSDSDDRGRKGRITIEITKDAKDLPGTTRGWMSASSVRTLSS